MKKINKKAEILKSYSKLCEKLHRPPTQTEITSQTGITKDMVTHHFSNLEILYKEAKKAYPKAFKNDLSNILNDATLSKLKAEIKKKERFVVTTAVTGCKVNKVFLDCINNYCKINDAKMLVLMSSDPAAKATRKGYIAPEIPKESIVVANLNLNSNLHLSTIKLSAKHIDPITGLSRLGQKNGSFIYASPKQRLKFIPVSNNKLAHAVMTTGSITNPDYGTDKFMSERTAYIAQNDHILGGIIVEIIDDVNFNFRQIQFKEDHFADLGKYYYSDKVEEVRAEGLVLGDWHAGSTDIKAIGAWQELSELIKPKYLVVHDLFDGKSINHHEENDIIIRANNAETNKLDLSQEFSKVAEDLGTRLSYMGDEVIVVASNHDEFLHRYLRECKFVEDPHNFKIAVKITDAWVNDGKDPLEYAVMELKDCGVKNIKWLKRDEDFKIAGIQVSSHGDCGSNGAKGNLQAMETAYGCSVSGHSHTPQILREAWAVGTSTYLSLEYNKKGASSWVQTSCIIYPDGSRQLINSINGKWHLV